MERIVGVIGQGFVGTAVREGLRCVHDVWTHDKKDGNLVQTWTDGSCSAGEYNLPFVRIASAVGAGPIFLCLPTPMMPDGRCFTGIVEEVVGELAKISGLGLVVAIKSTVPPGTTDMLNQRHPNLHVCFQPEFLTEAHATEDFKNQKYVVCGGDAYGVESIRDVYAEAYPHAKFFAMTAIEAELVKYFTNCGLACRVSLANEFAQICSALGVDYNRVIGVAKENALGKEDTRMGLTHWDVPGHDNTLGFGGSCFPKDLNALIYVAKQLGVDPMCMEAAWKKNLEVRPERDWEHLKGRAVVK